MKFLKKHNIQLDAKAYVGLLDRLHVAHENNTKINMYMMLKYSQ